MKKILLFTVLGVGLTGVVNAQEQPPEAPPPETPPPEAPPFEAPEPEVAVKPELRVGFGVRASFRALQHAAPGGGTSKDPELESGRLYLGGSLDRHWGATLDLDFSTDTDGHDEQPIRVLDAIGQLRVVDELNVWVGRLLPPSDRANLNGPYYQLAWDYPFVSAYPSIYAGRDNGLSIWGDVAGGFFKYEVGAFQGRKGTSNGSDNLLYAGRLQVDFLDPEPGYYTQDTYHGSKDVLALAFVMQGQNDGAGSSAQKADFLGLSVDALFDHRFACNAVLTLQGTLYRYDSGGAGFDTLGLPHGTGFLAQAGVLLPPFGYGRLQPVVRYQDLSKAARWDAGLNYVLKGHQARLSAGYYHLRDDAIGASAHGLVLGVQIQI